MKLKINAKAEGTAILIVMLILAVLAVVVGIAMAYTSNIAHQVERSNTLGNAIAIADGCLEHNFAQWRKVCQAPGIPKPPTSNQLSTLPLPTQAEFPQVANFTRTRNSYNPAFLVSQCKVEAIDPELVSTPAPNASPPPDVGEGGSRLTYNYRASAYVTLPERGGNIVAKVQRVFQQVQNSLFKYAIFYNDPLEIHPGAPFNVTGEVHTNSDLYTGHNFLSFNDAATYHGDWTVGFDPGSTSPYRPKDTAHNGETPQMPGGETPVLEKAVQYPSNILPDTFDSSDPNNTGYHELIEPPVPSSSPDPFANARFYNQADVIINIRDNPTPGQPDIVSIERGNHDGTTTPLSSSSGGNDKKLYDMFTGAITTGDSLQDNREGSSVGISTLDVSQLTNSKGSAVNGVQWQATFNGVVYVNNTSAAQNGVGAKRGIRLRNGGIMPDKGLTVASPNPVYVQGDFNTGTYGGTVNPPSQLPSNKGSFGQPYFNGYTVQPCAVIADAVNVLSNNWSDGNSGSVPLADPTTINTAIVSGNVTDGSGFKYTGGAENFPRFLENWGSQDFTYYGSMIELYQSRQAIGVWGKPNVYSPPDRHWYFENLFKLRQPPGADAFNSYTYNKGRWALVP